MFVDSPEKLRTVQAACEASSAIGIDTEFVSFPVYKPKLQLIQLSTPTLLACVDVTTIPADRLKSLMTTVASKTCVLHSCTTDLQLIRDVAGVVPAKLFDTQIAADFAGYGARLGLGDLIEELTDVRLDKTESLSDWRNRPLTPQQIRYALDDVKYLLRMHGVLTGLIVDRGREAWMREEMETALVVPQETKREDLWLSTRRLLKLKEQPKARAVLRELCAWRDDAAREADLAPLVLMRDDTLIALALSQPLTRTALEGIQGVKSNTLRFHGRTLLAAIQKGMDNASKGLCPELPPHLSPTRQEKSEAEALGFMLRAYVAARARELGMSSLLLADSEELDALALDPTLYKTRPFKLLSGWRKDAIGTDIVAMLDGTQLKWDAQARTVTKI